MKTKEPGKLRLQKKKQNKSQGKLIAPKIPYYEKYCSAMALQNLIPRIIYWQNVKERSRRQIYINIGQE